MFPYKYTSNIRLYWPGPASPPAIDTPSAAAHKHARRNPRRAWSCRSSLVCHTRHLLPTDIVFPCSSWVAWGYYARQVFCSREFLHPTPPLPTFPHAPPKFLTSCLRLLCDAGVLPHGIYTSHTPSPHLSPRFSHIPYKLPQVIIRRRCFTPGHLHIPHPLSSPLPTLHPHSSRVVWGYLDTSSRIVISFLFK